MILVLCTRSVDDYCACVQLPNGRLAGWSEISCLCWPISEGGGVLPFGLRHSMGPTGGGDVSDCVYYGVVIAVFSGGVGKAEGRVAKRTFTV